MKPWLRSSCVLLLCLTSMALAAWNWEQLQQQMRARFGAAAVAALQDWQTLMTSARPLPPMEQVNRVNGFFNQKLHFVDDSQTWGVADYWATPLETLGRGQGDCEDFAIIKYFSLIELGIPVRQLRLVYVKARIGGANSTLEQAHMVLTWFPSPEADPWVLDNLISEIRPASRRPDLTPIFSFNSEGITSSGSRAVTMDVNRLSRWRDLLERAQNNGLLERKSP